MFFATRIREAVSRPARWAVVSLALVCAGAGAPAAAQVPAQAPTPAVSAPGAVSEAELRALVQTLEDEAARRKLIVQLNGLIAARRGAEENPAPAGAGARIMAELSQRIEDISGGIVAATRLLVDAPKLIAWLRQQMRDPAARALWTDTVWKIVLVLALGVFGEWLVRIGLARPRRGLEGREVDSIWVRIPVLIARTVVDVLPIGVFMAVGYLVLPLLEPGAVARVVALALINASVIARAVVAVARMGLAPGASALRVFTISDVNANYAFIWVRRLTNVTVYGYFLSQVAALLGMPAAGAAALLKVVGLLVTLMLVALVLQNSAALARRLRGQDDGASTFGMLRQRLADIWHVLAVIYLVAVYGVWALEVEGGFEPLFVGTVLTLVILVAARIAAAALRRGLRRGFALSDRVRRQYPELEVRANRYVPVIERVGVALIYLIAAFSLLEAWHIDAFGWLGSAFGQRVTGSVLTIAGLLVAAVLAWEMISSAIARYLERGREGAAGISARAHTLLPLLRTVVLVVLVTLVVLVVLSELGVNIAPLLAGAGVVGLAVGFGSQALVKDVITGVFILMEDQMAVGDVVRTAGHAGLVENISLRTVRLRDLSGNVHIIPFSEVTTVENMTKEFSRYVFNVGIAYREDTDQVVEVLKEIGAELQQDEAFGALIVEPLEVLGVDSFDDSAVIIKARITTQPIKQWTVGREFNRRMKKRFDELGIEIPFPHSTIYFGEDRAGRAPPAHVRLQDAEDAEAALRERTGQTKPAGRRRRGAAASRDAGDDDGGDGGDGL